MGGGCLPYCRTSKKRDAAGRVGVVCHTAGQVRNGIRRGGGGGELFAVLQNDK